MEDRLNLLHSTRNLRHEIKEMALKRNDCLLLYTLYSVDLYKITAIFNKKLRKLIQTNSKYKKKRFSFITNDIELFLICRLTSSCVFNLYI